MVLIGNLAVLFIVYFVHKRNKKFGSKIYSVYVYYLVTHFWT